MIGVEFIVGGAALLIWLAGLLTCIDVLYSFRTAQGALGWVVFLLIVPFLALPLYWVFGHTRMRSYRKAMQAVDSTLDRHLEHLREYAADSADLDGSTVSCSALVKIAGQPATIGNQVRLLINGEMGYRELFAALERAEDYILVQYYIIRDDDLGRAFRDRLVAAAQRKVRVYLTYDAVGTSGLAASFWKPLREAGVVINPFKLRHGPAFRLQINFRNHRKLVVVDGKEALLGGLNIGDEYLGRKPELGPWRDTHLAAAGPMVQSAQLFFLEDWFWAGGEIPELNWQVQTAGEQSVLILAGGPGDDFETCGMFYTHLINAARERLWITTPYLVPDQGVIAALQLAALRGVDVRLIVPEKGDKYIVHLAGFAFYSALLGAGVKLYRYPEGFMHQKVILVDDTLAAVGSANLDNRSLRLNFEQMTVVFDKGFAAEVAAMLEKDLLTARRVMDEELDQRSPAFHILVRSARLLGPIL